MKNKVYTTVLPILFLIFPAMVLAAAPTGQVTSPKEINGFVKGAALDPDTLNWPIDVHFYIDCPSAPNTNDCLFIGSAKANEPVPVFGNHGFTFRVPEEYLTGNGVKKSLRDGSDHTLTLHGIDTGGGGGVLINNGQSYTFKLVGSPQIPPKQNSLKYFGYYNGGDYLLTPTSYTNTIMSLNPEELDRATAAGLKGIINIQNEAFSDTEWFNSPQATTYRSKIQSGFENGDVIAMAFTDEAWLRGYRSNAINRAAQRIKETFPNIPILYNEAYTTMVAKDPAFTFPTSVDWISFDHYIYDPRKNDLWMKFYELMKSKRSRPDQKIFIVMNAWWHPSNPFSKEDMAMVAKNYYELAKSDPDVIGINAWVWGGYEEDRGWVGTRDLPQSVRDEHKRIGNEITGPRGQILGYAGKQADGVINGWAVDYDTPEKSIDVHFYIDCPSTSSTDNCLFLGSTKADLPSPTINAEHGITAGKHRFNYRIPDFYLDSNGVTKNLRDGRPHTLLIKGIDTGGNGGFLLNVSYPFTFTLSGASSIPPTQNSLKYFGYYGASKDNDGFSAAPGNLLVQVWPGDIKAAAASGKKFFINLHRCNFLTPFTRPDGGSDCGQPFDNFNRWNIFLNGKPNDGISYDGTKSWKQIIQEGFDAGHIIGFIFPDEPRFAFTNDQIRIIAERLKTDFPRVPILLNESWPALTGDISRLIGDGSPIIIPSEIDWISFDHYIYNPRKNDLWMEYYELLKSKRSRSDQKIFVVMNAWWLQGNPFTQEGMATVAKNYYELARSDADVIGISVWLWPTEYGGTGARDLPQVVRDEHRRIADEIIKEPDLFIESIKTFPVREGASPKFKIKIKNQGKEPALASNLGWSIDGGATSTAAAPSILAGARAVVKPQISWVGAAGMHKFVLCADSNHTVIEGHNENNNCSKMEFVVEAATPPAGTDLFIQNVLVDSGIKVKIKNQGTSTFVPTDLSKAVLLVDGVQNPAQKSMRALIPGAAKNFAWKNLALAPGIHSFSVCAWVGDSNNANNCISGRFVTGKQAPLTAAAQARFTAKLSAGSRGAEVTKAQQLLKDEGYRTQNPTGTFDSLTASEVSELQADEDIPVTGVWDDATREAANEILGFEEDEPTPSPIPSPTPTPGVGASRTPKAGVAQKIIPTADRKLLNGIQQKTNELFGSVADYEKTLRAEQDEEKRGAAKPSVKKPPARAKVGTLKKVARERKKLMVELAEKDPRAFLRNAISKTKRTQLPKQVQSDIEEEITQDATLEVVHYDDFQNPENSYFRYSLLKDKKRFAFYPTRDIARSSGTKIRVKGYVLENAVVANIDSVAEFQVLADAPPPESVGDQKTLILLVHFTDTVMPRITAEELRNSIFNGDFQNFFREQSYGLTSFSGDVVGPYTLPLASTLDSADRCRRPSLGDPEVLQLIRDRNIPIQNYGRFVLVSDGPCVWTGGFSSLGKMPTDVNGVTLHISYATVSAKSLSEVTLYLPPSYPYFIKTFAHEMGHSLGVLHANSIRCDPPDIIYGQNCTHLEYGNLFDTMGAGNQSLHFNALFKETLGWLQEPPVTQSGEITLAPLESQTGRRYAKIQPRDASTPYYLEYRQPIGYDRWLAHPDLVSNQNGIFINLVQENSDYSVSPNWLNTWLLNMSPRASGDSDEGKDWQAVTLNKNAGVWRDAGRGITIGPVTSVTASSVTLNVDIADPVCEYHYPLNFPYFYSAVFSPSEKIGISVPIANRDSIPCGPSEFSYRLSSPAGWIFTPYESSPLVLNPFTSTRVNGEITVPNVVPGAYALEFSAKNLRSGLESVVAQAQITIAGTPPLAITFPNNGETWQLGDFHWIGWNSKAPASEVEAYLERSVNESFEVVGKIVPVGDLQNQASGFGWYGEINSSGTYAEPGKYYIRIKNISTGEEDRTDTPITLVPYGMVKADLKLDGSDGPIVIAEDGEHTVSWTSEKADGCFLGLNGLGEDQSGLPASGSRVVTLRRNSNDYAVSIYMSCFSSIGTGYDYVLIQPNLSDFSIDTYRIRKLRTKPDGTHVLVVKAKVKNAGPASAQAKVKVTVKKLRKFGEAFSSPKIIPSGQSKKLPLVRVEWKGIPQKYIAEICAMPVGSAIDTNTANDCVSQEITVPPAPAPRAKVSAFTKNLSIGSMGLEVTKVQQCLASELYLEETPTGTYGPQTEVAIKEFQTDEGIQATGVWNADTMKAANDLPCFEEYEPTPTPTPSPTVSVSLPSNPTPADGASNVALSTNLSWQAPADATSYYIYFGISPPAGGPTPPLRAENITEKSFNPGAMLPNTTYYWRVALWTASDIKIGPIWSFTTGDTVQPPQSSQAPTESSPTPTPTPSASSGQATPPPPTPTPTATPPPTQQVTLSITEARFTGTPSLKINGASKEFTFTLANSSNQILTGISYKAWIEQNGIKGKEVSRQITCGPGPGKVPATGCKEYGTIGATSPLSTSGSAEAKFQIIDSTGAIITQTSIPVTLTGGTAQVPSKSILAAISGGVQSIINSLANWLLGY